MMEKTGPCPLCGHDFGSKKEHASCPVCGIGLRRHVPIFRVSRSWYGELTEESTSKLRELWLNRT